VEHKKRGDLSNKSSFLVKDYAVSGETFSLRYIQEMDMFETIPKPTEEALPSYYESEDYISHTASPRNLFEKLYQLVRSFMVKRKCLLATKNASNKGSLLDIGCGTGDFLLEANKQGWYTFGVEPNLNARSLAKQKGLEVYQSLYEDELQAATFDVITLWHVLEHLPNLEEQITLIKRLLKPNGLLVIAVPNFKSYDAQYYKSYWAAYDVPRHLWHFSKTSIRKIFEPSGLHVVKIRPMWFDAFYVSMISESYKSASLKFVKGILIGLISNLSGIASKEFSSHIYLLKENN
jgi:SAM-dependent methyltransferase